MQTHSRLDAELLSVETGSIGLMSHILYTLQGPKMSPIKSPVPGESLQPDQLLPRPADSTSPTATWSNLISNSIWASSTTPSQLSCHVTLEKLAAQETQGYDPLYDLDPEIEITLRRLRKVRNIVVSNSSNSVSSSDNSSPVTNTSDSVEYTSTNNFAEPE
ncbi:hypothetical protein CR513_44012, partial [Mucuna pruriens]